MNAKLGEPVDEILETVGERGGELMRTSQGTQGSAGGLWAMVLAGGDGIRLQPLTRRLYGEPRPKQFAALIGTRSLLRQTLDRVALSIPPQQTVVVTRRAHAHYTAREIRGPGGPDGLGAAGRPRHRGGCPVPGPCCSPSDP